VDQYDWSLIRPALTVFLEMDFCVVDLNVWHIPILPPLSKSTKPSS